MFENFTSLASHDWKGRIIYQNYKYCFQPLNSWQLMEDGEWYYDLPYLQEDYEDLEIVARGIVSQYIRYEQEKSLKEIFADYYKGCFDTFKSNRKNDIELMLKSEKDLEIAFVETMIGDEKWRIEYSEKGIEKFSDYFSDEERKILKQVEKGVMDYLQDRLKDLKPGQEQPTTPTSTQTGENEERADTPIIDKDKLKTLFVNRFFNEDYDVQDTYSKSIKLSRFDKFCQRLEMVLTDTDKKPNQKTICGIAYMVYCSPYAEPEYRKPKKEGEKGRFAQLIRTFFDIVRMSCPSETSPNKYKKPSQELTDLFGDVLQWQ